MALILHHPASNHETRDQAQRLLAHYETELPPRLFVTAKQDRNVIASEELTVVTARVQVQLAEPAVSEMDILLQDALHEQNAGDETTSRPDLIEPLTTRELEVLRLIASGLSNQAIAEELIIAIGTVKAHASSIYGKLGVSNRAQAIIRAAELGIL